VPSSKTKRVLLAVAIAMVIIVLLAGVGAALYLHRVSQPLAGPVAGNPPDVFSLIPQDAPVVAYLDAKALKTTQNSSLQAIGQLVLPSPQQDPDYTEFVKKTGFDYTHDLDHAAIAMWPDSLDASANASGENPILAIADGRFDQEKMKAYALRTGHVVTRGTHTIYEVPGNPPVSFEFLSATRVAIASGKSATDMLTEAPTTHRDPAMQARIDRVAGAPLFAVARTDQLPDSFYASFRNSPQLLSNVKKVRALVLAGEPDGDNLDLTVDAECKSMSDAVQLGTLMEGLRMLGSMALSDPKARGQLTKQQAELLITLLSKMNISPQDNYVRLNLALTPQMLSGKVP
jgi:hypothetical protein